MTTLKDVKSVKLTTKPRIVVTNDEIDIAIAWIKDEISLGQILKAKGTDSNYGGNALYRIAIALREGYRKGRVKAE